MVSKIIDGIIQSVRAEFGEDSVIYTESVEQGLQEPCFFVRCINPHSSIYRGERYERRCQFVITYIPLAGSEYEQIYDAAEKLYSCLEYISAGGDLMMGTGMENEVEDKVLHVFVSYNGFAYKRAEVETIEEYTHNTNLEE